ncbi:hypothetical protein [Pleurocapsa sp. PCC 7319]|uniref:hypothetical protein n=1 Tax=Pleurocapsa sp. PCC 7319 TaxID=118161 RepID=UPI00034CDA87|nr:hypothetical protein [Pleurocapsa sp. PCC 7319]
MASPPDFFEKVHISLNGNLDYLVWGNNELLIIEPKNDDFVGGTKQLISELVAVTIEQQISFLYGAVSNGITWQFIKLEQNQIIQDTNYYSFPQNSQELFLALLKIFDKKS